MVLPVPRFLAAVTLVVVGSLSSVCSWELKIIVGLLIFFSSNIIFIFP